MPVVHKQTKKSTIKYSKLNRRKLLVQLITLQLELARQMVLVLAYSVKILGQNQALLEVDRPLSRMIQFHIPWYKVNL